MQGRIARPKDDKVRTRLFAAEIAARNGEAAEEADEEDLTEIDQPTPSKKNGRTASHKFYSHAQASGKTIVSPDPSDAMDTSPVPESGGFSSIDSVIESGADANDTCEADRGRSVEINNKPLERAKGSRRTRSTSPFTRWGRVKPTDTPSSHTGLESQEAIKPVASSSRRVPSSAKREGSPLTRPGKRARNDGSPAG
jgi:hypothetical protein